MGQVTEHPLGSASRFTSIHVELYVAASFKTTRQGPYQREQPICMCCARHDSHYISRCGKQVAAFGARLVKHMLMNTLSIASNGKWSLLLDQELFERAFERENGIRKHRKSYIERSCVDMCESAFVGGKKSCKTACKTWLRLGYRRNAAAGSCTGIDRQRQLQRHREAHPFEAD